jgi:hypothetical protein
MRYAYHSRPWKQVFEGDADAAAKAAADKKTADDAAAAAAASRMFSQEAVNKILAEDRRKHAAKQQQFLEELTQLRESKNLSEQEKATLDTRIEELSATLKTKEELAAQERKRLSETHSKELKAASDERDQWKVRYTESLIATEITNAAVSQKAFSPEQIVALLRPATRLAEDIDGDGKPTGKLVPKVTFNDTKDDKPITLDLTVADAVKRMKDQERFQNLFIADGTGGVGGMSKTKGKKPDLLDIAKDPAKYRAARKDGTIK